MSNDNIAELAKKKQLTIEHLKELESQKKLYVLQTDSENNTALYYAIINHNNEVAKWLIDRMDSVSLQTGPEIEIGKDPNKTTHLCRYSTLAAYHNNVEIFKYIHQTKYNSIIQGSPLEFAAANNSLPIIRIILNPATKQNIQQYPISSSNASYFALMNKNYAALQILANYGRSYPTLKELKTLNMPQCYGWTAMHYVCKDGNYKQIIDVLTLGGYKDWEKSGGSPAITALGLLSKRQGSDAIFKIKNIYEEVKKSLPLYFANHINLNLSPGERIKYIRNAYIVTKEVKGTEAVYLLFNTCLKNKNYLEAIGFFEEENQAIQMDKIALRLAAHILTDEYFWISEQKQASTKNVLQLLLQEANLDNEQSVNILDALYKKWNIEATLSKQDKVIISISSLIQDVLNQLEVPVTTLNNSTPDGDATAILARDNQIKSLKNQIFYLNLLHANPTSKVALQLALQLDCIQDSLLKLVNNKEYILVNKLIDTFPILSNSYTICKEITLLLSSINEDAIQQLDDCLFKEKVEKIRTQFPFTLTKTREMICYHEKLAPNKEYQRFLENKNANDLFDAFLKFGNINTDVKQPKNKSMVTRDLAKDEEAIVDIYATYETIINHNTAFIAVHRTFLQSNLDAEDVKRKILLFNQVIIALNEECRLEKIQPFFSEITQSSTFLSFKKSSPLNDRFHDLLALPPAVLKFRFEEYRAYLKSFPADTLSVMPQFSIRERQLVQSLLAGISIQVKESEPTVQSDRYMPDL